jgi:NhaP-type Na+/H+ or K+/H+ antiporter
MATGEKLFVGWFGPRGLASIVFAVIIFDAAVPGRDTLVITTTCTVLLSILAHGATANPLVAIFLRSRRNAG